MKDNNKIGFGIMIGSLLCMLLLLMIGNEDSIICIVPIVIGALMYN